MKCVKVIKSIMGKEPGHVIRTTDRDAQDRVKSGFWAYAPKSEYKTYVKPVKTESTEAKKTVEKKIKIKNDKR